MKAPYRGVLPDGEGCQVTIPHPTQGGWRHVCGHPVVAGPVVGKPKSVAVCAQHLADRIRLMGGAA